MDKTTKKSERLLQITLPKNLLPVIGFEVLNILLLLYEIYRELVLPFMTTDRQNLRQYPLTYAVTGSLEFSMYYIMSLPIQLCILIAIVTIIFMSISMKSKRDKAKKAFVRVFSIIGLVQFVGKVLLWIPSFTGQPTLQETLRDECFQRSVVYYLLGIIIIITPYIITTVRVRHQTA